MNRARESKKVCQICHLIGDHYTYQHGRHCTKCKKNNCHEAEKCLKDKCSRCLKDGHDSDECDEEECDSCGKIGHNSNECYENKKPCSFCYKIRGFRINNKTNKPDIPKEFIYKHDEESCPNICYYCKDVGMAFLNHTTIECEIKPKDFKYKPKEMTSKSTSENIKLDTTKVDTTKVDNIKSNKSTANTEQKSNFVTKVVSKKVIDKPSFADIVKIKLTDEISNTNNTIINSEKNKDNENIKSEEVDFVKLIKPVHPIKPIERPIVNKLSEISETKINDREEVVTHVPSFLDYRNEQVNLTGHTNNKDEYQKLEQTQQFVEQTQQFVQQISHQGYPNLTQYVPPGFPPIPLQTPMHNQSHNNVLTQNYPNYPGHNHSYPHMIHHASYLGPPIGGYPMIHHAHPSGYPPMIHHVTPQGYPPIIHQASPPAIPPVYPPMVHGSPSGYPPIVHQSHPPGYPPMVHHAPYPGYPPMVHHAPYPGYPQYNPNINSPTGQNFNVQQGVSI